MILDPSPSPASMRMHATCVSVFGRGILLMGDSGAGKSDFALRLIDRGHALVADDQVLLRVQDGALVASAPESIQGKLEVRGVGIVQEPFVCEIEVNRVITLLPTEQSVERFPRHHTTDILGIAILHFSLHPFEASAPFKVERLVMQ